MVPAVEQVESVRELVTALQQLRTQSGSPSYAELANRIGEIRATRGLPAAHAAPSKSTVYEAFKPDRKRVDATLIEDIVTALDSTAEPRSWRDAALRLSSSGPLHLPEIVTVGDAPKTQRFIGREEALRDIPVQLITDGSLDLVGLPGIGKSSLAARVARELAPQFEETLWISMRGHSAATLPVDPDALARALLDRWQFTYESTRVKEEVAHRLHTKNVLLVLDDAVSAEQVRPFIADRAGRSRALITSRRPLGVATEYTLEPLELHESLQFLELDTSKEGAVSLAGSCGGIPLALEIALSRVRERPGWTVADHAAAAQSTTDAFDPLNQRIRHSYTLLSPKLRSALVQLAQFPGTQADLAQAEWLLGVDGETTEQLLRQLAETGLLRLSENGWSLHDFVRAFAASVAHESTPPSELRESFTRFCERMITRTTAVLFALDITGSQFASWADELELEEVEPADARRWIESHIPTVFSTAAKALEHGDLQSAARFATLMYSFGLVGTDGEAALELQRTTRALSERLGDRFEQMRSLMREGALLVFRLGRAEEAYLPLKWAEDICRAMPEHPEALRSMASIKNSQAARATLADDLESAEKAFRELLPIVQEAGDERLRYPVLVNLVEVLLRAGKLEESVDIGMKAFRKAEELGLEREVVSLCLNLTDALIAQGDLTTAVEVSNRGADIAREFQHRVPLGFFSSSRALLAMKQQRADDAKALLADAQELARETRHRELAAFVAETEAHIIRLEGRLSEAKVAAEHAVELASASADAGRVRTARKLLDDINAELER